MATGTYAPDPDLTVRDSNGTIISGGLVWTYLAGTTTPAATYTDVGLTSANTNPIVANSQGRFVAFLAPGASYKFVYETAATPPAHGSVIITRDNISAVPASSANLDVTGTAGEALTAGQAVYLSDGSGGKVAGQWYKGDSANTYSSTLPEVGMVPASITSGASGTIRLAGSMTGLAALTIGSTYYIGTAGAITATPPTNARALGVADTTTSLILKDVPPVSSTIDNRTMDFRLTLTSGSPVTTSDVTAATTLYAAPYAGNRIVLYDASGTPTVYTSAQFSIAVPATTSQMYDVFCYANGTTPTLELTAWTNDTTRATALVSNVAVGVYTKTGDATRRYLGSFRTTGVSGQTEDSLTKRYVFNYYNRVRRPLQRIETTASWTYTTATLRQANNAAANQVECVTGISEDPVDVQLQVQAGNDTGGMTVAGGFGLDSTTAFASGNQIGRNQQIKTAASLLNLFARYVGFPGIGWHRLVWLEWSVATGTTTWYGNNGQNLEQSGILGHVWQ